MRDYGYSNGRFVRAVVLPLMLLALTGCSAATVADLPVVGVPKGAPARPTDTGQFPAVHDMPAARAEPALQPAEQTKIENELAVARDRQAAAAAAANAADAPAKKPPKGQ